MNATQTGFYKNNYNNILMSDISVPAVENSDVEGVKYINVSKHSTTELGRSLSYGCPVNVRTVFGKIGTVRAAMDFVKTPGYPVKLLGAKKLYPKDINTIPKSTLSVPNYWAIVAYILCERVDQDSRLKKLLRKNKAPIFTSFNAAGDYRLFGKLVTLNLVNGKMGRYLSIIRHIEKMLKANEFTKENIEQFVLACKDHPELDLFEKSTVMITMSSIKTENTVNTDDFEGDELNSLESAGVLTGKNPELYVGENLEPEKTPIDEYVVDEPTANN